MVDKDEIIDKMRFMVSPLSRLADNIAEGLHKVKCKDCMSGLEYVAGKDDILTFKCVDCNKNYEKVFDKNFVWSCGKVFILMSRWIVAKDS